MNYLYHAIIGVGITACGALAAEAAGAPEATPAVLGLGALAAAAGSIATDLDHPRSFISNTIPSHTVRITLAVLAIPSMAALGSYLTTNNLNSTLSDFTAMIWGIHFLRWTAFALGAALGLMLLALILYSSLHHRGALHSLLFTVLITGVMSVVFLLAGSSWTWGLIFGWGWLWHILADGLTVLGVPFFWPFNDDRKHTLPTIFCRPAQIVLTFIAVGGILALILLRIKNLLV